MWLLVCTWLSATAGQCTIPTHLWPTDYGLLTLVALTNQPLPCAELLDAGPNQSGFTNQTFNLSGRLFAVPPKNHTLAWRQTHGPATVISNPQALETSFQPNAPGTYAFVLEIAGENWIAADQVSYVVTSTEAEVQGLVVEMIANNLELPVQITAAPGHPDTLYVVEQRGKVRLIENDQLRDSIFLDFDPDPNDPVLWDCFECGMLGLTFDPNYDSNGLFYVSFTGKVTPEEDPDNWASQEVTRIFVYRQKPGGLSGVFERKLLLSIPQPFRNHHGGQMAFGPDGMFYIALGDSSPCGDPDNHAQNMSLLLGKMLRFETNGFAPLSIPADNPFVSTPGIRPEIWASGFRNPWRWSFDSLTGDVFWGDVGQETFEEINWQPAGMAGENYGWRIKEGNDCYVPRDVCGTTPICPQMGLRDPILAYQHNTTSCAVIGGLVYRGNAFQQLNGTYVFGDFCNTQLMALEPEMGGWQLKQLPLTIHGPPLNGGLLTIGNNLAGDLYFATQNQIFKVVQIDATE